MCVCKRQELKIDTSRENIRTNEKETIIKSYILEIVLWGGKKYLNTERVLHVLHTIKYINARFLK